MTNNKLLIGIAAVGLYLFTTGISYFLFSTFSSSETISPVQTSKKSSFDAMEFDSKAPKTEECPLSGAMYSKEQRIWWEKHRPLGVMIENHQEARPQSGISSADVVYEAVAEGGITRFLSIFYCKDAGKIGPVRSARTYFLDWVSEYGSFPLYVHVGGANCNEETGSGCGNGRKADALGQIIKYGWQGYNDLSQFNVDFPTFARIEKPNGFEVATEHTMFSNTGLLWKEAEKRGLTQKDEDGDAWDDSFVKYSFKDEVKLSDRPLSQTIDVQFWSNQPNYNVEWQYNKDRNVYLRSNGGKVHIDATTKSQLSPKNLVILFMNESSANDGYDNNVHLLYGDRGKGDAMVFQDGKKTVAKWSKKDREARTVVTDSKGKEIEFNRGQLWFEIIPIDSDVTVK